MPATNLDAQSLVALYRRMRLIRRFEERTEELLDAGEIRAHAHLYIGEEAVAVGAAVQGAILRAGAAHAIGFVPKTGLDPKVGTV